MAELERAAGERGAARLWGGLGALHGAVAVIAGSFAAHAVSDPRAIELLDTGARWEAVSGLAAVAAALVGSRIAGALHVAGALVFAGALYVLAFGAPSLAGAVAPIGGLAMIAGWIALAVALLRGRSTGG
jgi:uncharacterized membrane protein YgdD (TMEM256/DUF423 family)